MLFLILDRFLDGRNLDQDQGPGGTPCRASAAMPARVASPLLDKADTMTYEKQPSQATSWSLRNGSPGRPCARQVAVIALIQESQDAQEHDPSGRSRVLGCRGGW